MTGESSDLGDDLRILKITRQDAGNGAWFKGMVAGHRFEALVFQGHADGQEWELGQSQISKLWIKRLADKQTVFNWDRGQDVPAADEATYAVVDFLAAGLAHLVFGAQR